MSFLIDQVRNASSPFSQLYADHTGSVPPPHPPPPRVWGVGLGKGAATFVKSRRKLTVPRGSLWRLLFGSRVQRAAQPVLSV